MGDRGGGPIRRAGLCCRCGRTDAWCAVRHSPVGRACRPEDQHLSGGLQLGAATRASGLRPPAAARPRLGPGRGQLNRGEQALDRVDDGLSANSDTPPAASATSDSSPQVQLRPSLAVLLAPGSPSLPELFRWTITIEPPPRASMFAPDRDRPSPGSPPAYVGGVTAHRRLGHPRPSLAVGPPGHQHVAHVTPRTWPRRPEHLGLGRLPPSASSSPVGGGGGGGGGGGVKRGPGACQVLLPRRGSVHSPPCQMWLHL